MGLDMYLERMKTPREMGGNNPYSFDELKQLYVYTQKLPDDKLKEYQSDVDAGNIFEDNRYIPVIRGTEEVGYWRKSNQIHAWFVRNVQSGNDDCGYYVVPKEKLEELLVICQKVLASSELIDGKVKNGYTFKDGKEIPIYQDGKYIKDPAIAKELLPCTSGFFFGSTDYDEYYYNDIEETIKILQKVLAETNFDEYTILYTSSW